MNWQLIETAPVADLIDNPPTRCLVWSKDFGIQMGRAWRYPDGEACAQGDGHNGEWNVTHWMPLPEPPK